jgi:hypothetical protein
MRFNRLNAIKQLARIRSELDKLRENMPVTSGVSRSIASAAAHTERAAHKLRLDLRNEAEAKAHATLERLENDDET